MKTITDNIDNKLVEIRSVAYKLIKNSADNNYREDIWDVTNTFLKFNDQYEKH
mgnify:CR=1 FL=1